MIRLLIRWRTKLFVQLLDTDRLHYHFIDVITVKSRKYRSVFKLRIER